MFETGFDFANYVEDVRRGFRYVHSDHVHRFLANLTESTLDRAKAMPFRSQVWRAQLGCDTVTIEEQLADFDLQYPHDIAYSATRMKPHPNAAHEGRVNPKGIPCLYAATDRETAMAEVRPWLHAKISVGQFVTARELKLVDCSRYHDRRLNPAALSKSATTDVLTEAAWTMVDQAFSKPVTDDSLTAEYVPTQIIAEAFRRQGFDGLMYKSRLGDGFNLALFDLGAADLELCYLYRASSLRYEFELFND
jgi:hypothetical protein